MHFHTDLQKCSCPGRADELMKYKLSPRESEQREGRGVDNKGLSDTRERVQFTYEFIAESLYFTGLIEK